MKTFWSALGLTIAVSVSAPVGAQNKEVIEKTIDLGAPVHDTVHILPGTYRFKITSLSPKYRYVIRISTGMEQITPISHTEFLGATSACDAFSKAAEALGKATDEKDVAGFVADLRMKMTDPAAADCPNRSGAEDLIAYTDTIPDETVSPKVGQYVSVYIGRVEDQAITTHWERRFTTGAASWRASYGFTFPVQRPFDWDRAGGQIYEARTLDSTRSVVGYQRRHTSFDAMPTVAFTWAGRGERPSVLGLTAGIGADITKPQFMLGPSLILWSNLFITAGIAAREELVAGGRSVGDTLVTKSDTAGLNKQAYRARPFIAFTLRFDKNPFSAKPAAAVEAATDKKAGKADDTKTKAPAKDDTKTAGKAPTTGTETKKPPFGI